MSQANQADFFGEGVFGPDDFLPNEALLAENNKKRAAAAAADAERLRLSSIAFGTPVTQGGTAQQMTVQQEGIGTKNATSGRMNGPGQVVGVSNGPGAPTYGPGGGPGLGGTASDTLASGNVAADTVMGSDPTVRPNHAVNNANVANLTPVIDPLAAQNDAVDQALAMSQDLVDRVLGTPLQTSMLADQVLSNQLAIARSTRGGAGAVQDAMSTASLAAPQLMQQASQASINEQVARAGAAGQAASIFAGVAGDTANRQLAIAQANQGAALSVINNLTQLTGLDYAFDTAKMNAIGQLARDFFNTSAQYANMDVQMQIAAWNDATARYGIDKNFKAAIEKISADEGIGPLDALKMALGGAAAVGGLAVGGPAGAAVAGAGANQALS